MCTRNGYSAGFGLPADAVENSAQTAKTLKPQNKIRRIEITPCKDGIIIRHAT
jgi:hypothetical protein